MLVLKSYQSEEVDKLVTELREHFKQWPLAKVTVKEFTQGPVTDQPITIRLMSDSLTDLTKVSNDLAQKLASIEGVVNIDNPIGQANTELQLVIDYQQAAMLNVDIHQLDMTVSTALSGYSVGKLSADNGENYPVVIRARTTEIDVLKELDIANRTGQLIPLEQLVKTQLVQGKADFFHYQKQRMAKVSADGAQGYTITELTQQVVGFLDNYQMPQGMYYHLGGEEASRKKSFAGLFQVMIITAVGIFAILVLQFKSILQPLIIFTSIPFAIAGSVIGLYLFNLSFSMMAFIGLISLFGIVVNNAIILIDTVNKNLKNGQAKRSAIIGASATRFTPILLTTLTTIGGLLPLTLFGGNLWQPLGVVIISGLCVSALASFILVPALTDIFTKQKQA